MGTVVYQQGFQSQLNEPRALRLRLSSPNTHFSQSFGLLTLKSHSEDSQNPIHDKPSPSSVPDSNGWSFLQSLSSSSSSSISNTSSKNENEKEKAYVQRPSSCKTLSNESLALCTENLGSETGSDVTDVEDLFSLSISNKNLEETTKTMETRRLKSKKGNVSPSDLPPPLTTMRGFQCIQMKPHREDGRLVMTAINAPPRNRCFQADRSNGRLRLSILKDSDEFVPETEETEEEYEEEEEEDQDIEEEEEEYDDDEVMDMENVQRSRRCIEGERENRGLLNWESLCVATS